MIPADWLASLRSRGDVKRAGEAIDRDPALRQHALGLAAKRNLEVDPAWPGKRLVRALLDRAEEAQKIGNPTKIDEAFTCSACGRDVPRHGRTARDHCPFCLRSLHVDVIPGDRAADCGGLLDPVAFELRHNEPVITFRCRKCGATKVNRAATDGAPPDDSGVLLRLSRGEVV